MESEENFRDGFVIDACLKTSPSIFDMIFGLTEIQREVCFAMLRNRESSCKVKMVLDECDCCDRKDFSRCKRDYNDKIQQQIDELLKDPRFRVEKKKCSSCLLHQYPHILFEIFWKK